MYKTILFLILFIFLSGNIDATPIIKPCDTEFKIKEYLKHSNTYLWYARYRTNSRDEFKVAKEYLDSAEVLLAKDSACYELFSEQSNSLKITLKNALDISIDNLNGRYPLYMDAIGRNSDLEYIDETEEIVLEKSLMDLIEFYYYMPSKPIKDIMHYSVIIGLENKPVLEEVAQQFLTKHTNSYIINEYDLASILTIKQISDLKNNKAEADIFDLIGKKYHCNKVGVYRIKKKDEVNKIFYYGSVYKTFNLSENRYDYTAMAESFSADRTETSSVFYTVLLEILLLNLILLLIFKLVGKYSEWWKGKLSGSAGFGIHFLIDSICLVTSFVIAFGGGVLLSYLAPFEGAFHKEPMAIIWGISSITIIPILSLFINFYAFSKLLKSIKVYRDANSLMAITMGSLSGLLIYAFYLYTYRYNEAPPFGYLASFIIPSHLSSIPLSIALISLFKESSKARQFKKSLVRLVLSIASISYIYYSIWLNPDLITYWEWKHVIVSMLIILGAFVIPEIQFSKRIKKLFKFLINVENEENEENIEIKNNDDLYKLLKNPPSFNINPELSTELIDFIRKETSDNKIKTIYLKENIDAGKTTFIKEFILKPLHIEAENTAALDFVSFYGDCDEFQDGNTVPYEPFVQAFETIIGKEGTSNKGEKSMDSIFEKLSKIENLGVLKSFTGDDTVNEVKYEQQDLLKVIITVIDKLTDPGFTVIVFDDIQWIDNKSFELLKALTKELGRLDPNSRAKLTIIFAHSEIDQNNKSSAPISQNDKVKEFINHPLSILQDKYYSYKDPEGDLSSKFKASEYFQAITKEAGLEMNALDRSLVNSFMKKSGLETPSLVQIFLSNCVKQGLLSLNGNDILVQDNVDFTKVNHSSEVNKYYQELFSTLDPKLINILETAAYIGNDFEATVLGNVWDMTRLDVLLLLRQAQKIGLIIDKSEHDDVFQFKSKIIIKQLREYSVSSFTNSQSDKQAVPQLIKLYHKKIIEAFEGLSQEKQNTVDYNMICSMAERAYAYKENLHEKALKYTSLAFSLSIEKGNLMNAKIYFEYFLDLIKDPFEVTSQLLETFYQGAELLNDSNESGKIIEPAEAILKQLIGNDLIKEEVAGKLFSQYLSAYNASDKKVEIDSLISVNIEAVEDKYSEITLMEIQFQQLLIKEKPNENIETLEKMHSLVKECSLDEKFYNTHKKLLNSLAYRYLYEPNVRDLGKSKELFVSNLQLIAKRANITLSDDYQIFNQLLNPDLFNNLHNNDKMSLKYISGGLIGVYLELNEVENAQNILAISLKINTILMDELGIGLSYKRKSEILIKEKKFNDDLKQAFKDALSYFFSNLTSNPMKVTFHISTVIESWNKSLEANPSMDEDDFKDAVNTIKKLQKKNNFDIELVGDKELKNRVIEILSKH